jgi:UDP:flavonoid glycosyltransferase YjiC (YdhE family)
MPKPSIIMVTSNGIGAGHLIRAGAIARALEHRARPVVLSMAHSVMDVAAALDLEAEYLPSIDENLMGRATWSRYLRDRLVSLIDETGARVVTIDSVVPYLGVIAAKMERPEIGLVWIRRGMWQRGSDDSLLGRQSGLMDLVIEPGDLAGDYDEGPTKHRTDAELVQPVSMYQVTSARPRDEARRILGLSLDQPAVLIQLGVGTGDLDARVSAVLRGLAGWEHLRVVMTREPRDHLGRSLVPDGIEVTVIKRFPLADVLQAFDAVVCAAGYNSVHEVLPAAVPALLVANNRGTDDQMGRARWCADQGLALVAVTGLPGEIEEQAAQLKHREVRERLSAACGRIGGLAGAQQVADRLLSAAEEAPSSRRPQRWRYQQFLWRSVVREGARQLIRGEVQRFRGAASLVKRAMRPHAADDSAVDGVCFSSSRDDAFVRDCIRRKVRFEHLLVHASKSYIMQRRCIASFAYGHL